jgi:septal ring factor EnvC (AmiA/AmiB activator)
MHKMRFKYRVSVLNENTLEETWHLRLSRFSVFLYMSAFIFITFFLLTILIINTPIANYLPGYNDDGNRSKIIQQSMIVDSLDQKNELNDKYLDVLKNIILGRIKADSIHSLDSAAMKAKKNIQLDKSSKEKEFAEAYEKDEKYNLASIESHPTEEQYVFFKPTRGVISSSFDLTTRQFGIYMITSPNESVMSVLPGTVLLTSFTFENGWIIQVQHENNYISIYENCTRVLKKVGDFVRAGESIAITGNNTGKKAGEQFYFELWKMGKPINPEEVIIF